MSVNQDGREIRLSIQNKCRYLVLLVCILGVFHLKAQEEDKLGSWYAYNGFFNFSPKIELFFETHWRTYEPISDTEEVFVRPFLNLNLGQQFQIGIGNEYHMDWTFGGDGQDKIKTEEYRLTFQGMLFQQIQRIKIQHRYRYEFRFLDKDGQQRMRYRLQLGIPLNDKSNEKGSVFLTGGTEFMVFTQPSFTLSQMRFYAMFGYQFSKSTHLQFGYMRIVRDGIPGLDRLQFFLTQKFNFYKKEPNGI